MATREELLLHLWKVVINSNVRDDALDNIFRTYRRDPDGPFGDTAPALERILNAGAAKRDVCIILRETAYTAVFATLYAINNPGADRDDVFMLHEQLLMADPSGMDGRPGSADAGLTKSDPTSRPGA